MLLENVGAGNGISVFTVRHVDEMGMDSVARQAIDHLRHFPRIHVSLDMGILGDSGLIQSMDIVEINPILDRMNKTAELAVELAASLLGQRIL